MASPDWEIDDSEATIAYGGETEEDTSTSSITSTCGKDASGPKDVKEEEDDDGDDLESVYLTRRTWGGVDFRSVKTCVLEG